MIPMRLLHRAILTSLFILSVGSQAFAWQGQVVGVSDGDTIKVLHDGQQVKIRLYGVDTPEKKQAFGQAARKFTESMVAGKVVEVEAVDTDRYGRTVGLITVNGQLLNEELVKNGFAWVYLQYCKRPECSAWQKLEQAARQGRMGLWSEPNPTAPWDWRRMGSK